MAQTFIEEIEIEGLCGGGSLHDRR